MTETTLRLDRYGLIGYPVSHSRSPIIHRIFAGQTDQRMSYELIEATPTQLDMAIKKFQRDGGRGLNVTVPHKSEVVRLVDELSERASIAGAVNTLTIEDKRILGDNTDGIGLVRDLENNHGYDLAYKNVLILGAGGATRGLIGPLLEQKISSVTIANRTLTKAKGLADHFSSLGDVNACRFRDVDADGNYDLIINATSAGLHGEVPPFPDQAVNEDSFCYDLSYGANTPPFIEWAMRNNARKAVNGWGMLVEQAAESFLIWRGERPDTEDLRKQFALLRNRTSEKPAAESV